MSTDIITVTDQDFQRQVLRSDLPVLVECWAEWCGPLPHGRLVLPCHPG